MDMDFDREMFELLTKIKKKYSDGTYKLADECVSQNNLIPNTETMLACIQVYNIRHNL